MTTNPTFSDIPIENIFLRITVGATPVRGSGKSNAWDFFYWGGGQLIDFNMQTCEGSNPNTVSFSVYDGDGKLAEKYFNVIKKIDGLEPIASPAKDSTNINVPFNGDKQKFAVEYFRQAGFGNYAIAAMLGNIQQESNFNEAALNDDQCPGGSSDPANPCTSVGLIQWTFDRKNGLPNDYQGQIAFTLTDMQKDSPSSLATLKNKQASEADVKEAMSDWIRWGDVGNRWEYAAEYLKQIEAAKPSKAAEESVSTATANKKSPGKEQSLAGQQITVELGANGRPISKYSFLHTGLRYDLYDSSILKFDGGSASLVMGLVSENTAYQNITTKGLAQKLADKHGLTLQMEEEGSEYVYLSQKNETDMELLKKEAERIGLTIKKEGKKLIVEQRKAEPTDIIIRRNNVTSFSVSHTAGSGDKGAREPKGNNTAGQKKYTIDPLTGNMKAVEEEVKDKKEGTGIVSTTGSNTEQKKPLVKEEKEKPNKERKASEDRVKGLLLEVALPLTEQIIASKVDNAIKTEGIVQDALFLDKYWVLDKIDITVNNSGFIAKLTAYTPLKDKSPKTAESKSISGFPGSKPDGFINPNPSGTETSPFGPRNGGFHSGVDISAGSAVSIYASADGAVSAIETGCSVGNPDCGGGYGNFVFITHGGGFETRYAHLSSVSVSVGQSVKQGNVLGTEGNTGNSFSSHLHFEIRSGGTAVDPSPLIGL